MHLKAITIISSVLKTAALPRPTSATVTSREHALKPILLISYEPNQFQIDASSNISKTQLRRRFTSWFV